jgi:hypothetical protein
MGIWQHICEVGLRGLLHGSSIQIQMRQLNEDLWCECHMQWLRINMQGNDLLHIIVP